MAFVLSLMWSSLWVRCRYKCITNTNPFVPPHTPRHEGTSHKFSGSLVRTRRHSEVTSLAQGHRARMQMQAVWPQSCEFSPLGHAAGALPSAGSEGGRRRGPSVSASEFENLDILEAFHLVSFSLFCFKSGQSVVAHSSHTHRTLWSVHLLCQGPGNVL